MTVDVEFLCVDIRPLEKIRERQLPAFLKELHRYNKLIEDKGEPEHHRRLHYRNVGMCTTKREVERSYFQACNTIKFPEFIGHRLAFKSDGTEYVLFRKNSKVRRHFSSDDFGVTNRLKLGFQFDLQVGENVPNGKKFTMDLLNYILGLKSKRQTVEQKIKIKIEGHSDEGKESSIAELGAWMQDTILDSTRCKSEKKKHSKKDEMVEHIATTVVVTYTEGDLPDLPIGTCEFQIPGWSEPVKLFYFDPNNASNVRIYFIEEEKEKHNASFIHNLSHNLLDMRTNYKCMAHTFDMERLKRLNYQRLKEFAKKLIKRREELKKKQRYGLLDQKDNDIGQICDGGKRSQIEMFLKFMELSNTIN
ncbi:MAG: hypothetical protein LBM20_05915 [Rikenellaceae bacterium]|jgi:hypothetical protein|nr:hypothetical protein [Rikenellaceae bacterium]